LGKVGCEANVCGKIGSIEKAENIRKTKKGNVRIIMKLWEK
jgi:hypothetical protein